MSLWLRRAGKFGEQEQWLLLAIILVIVFYLNYYLKGSEVVTLSIPLFLALLPLIIDLGKERLEAQAKERTMGKEIKKIKDYLQNFFHQELVTPKISEFQDVEDIYGQFIKLNFVPITELKTNSLLLCFHCHIWDKTNKPDEYERIQSYSNSLGLSFADIDEKAKTFLKIYYAFNQSKKYKTLDEILNTTIDYVEVLRDFSQRYFKELSFFDIKERLNQSENLRETLVKLIKEGKLSNWGLTKETLEKLEADLKKELAYSKTFLVIGNNLNEEVKEYLRSEPGLKGWNPSLRNVPKSGLNYSAYVIKPRGIFPDAKKLLKKLVSLNKEGEESILSVIPLDFLNYESYTLPSNQSFTSPNLKDCYDGINWFRTGYEYSDTDIWNVIGKSTITAHELLSIIPFNIFCKGILPCEQTFMLMNYKPIKDKCGVNILSDWKDKDADLIVNYLLECGTPHYSKSEKERILMVKNYENIKIAVELRMKKLVDQIVKNSQELDKSLSLMLR